MRRLPFCTLAARERLAAASHSLPSSPNERNGGDTIAIYHCSIKIVSRGKGKSAVAAAAYRSGEKLTNEWDGLTHDYTKKGGVVHSEILLPAHAPPAFSDRSTLWNSVELSEKSNNAQLAREVEIALPVELSREEQTRLVREYCSSQFVSKGMIADFNLHDTGGGNPHAHILLTMRPLDEKGAWLPKSKKEYVLDENGEKIRLPSGRYKTRKVDLVDWNNRENAEVWRRAWADLTNEFLAQNNRPERIDHRSHAARGMDELPTVHMGVAASQMEKKGVATDKGEINRMIRKTNRIIREIRGYIDEVREWLAEVFRTKKELQAAPRSPDIATLLTKYLSVERERSRKYSVSWQQKHSASELQKISRAIVYLQAKGVANPEIKYFNCSNYKGNRGTCTSTHYVRVDFLEEVVLGEIRRLTKFASLYEDEFVKAVIGHSQQAEQTDRKLKEKELKTLLARDEELDGLFERIYEDNVSGKLSDDRFAKMSRRYEDEQKELAEKIKKLRSEIEKQSSRSMTTDMFIGLVRKYTRARKLTPRMLNELIEKIEVFNAEKIDGVWEQRLRIHYNCVGTIEIPTVLPLPIPEVSVNTRKGVVVNYAPCELAV